MKRGMLVFSVLLILATACTSAPTPTFVPSTPTATALGPTSTPIPPTFTPLPTATATLVLPTATATLQPTSTPTISLQTWAIDSFGSVDPQTMYPIVGAVNFRHRKTIDLSYGNLRLAIVTDQDLTKLDRDSQKNLRTNLMTTLGQNADVIKRLMAVRESLTKEQVSIPNSVVVFEAERPVEVVVRQPPAMRYRIDARGNLTKVEQMPSLLPQLRAEGTYLVRIDLDDDDQRRIVFKGVNILNYQGDGGSPTLTLARPYIATAKKWGSNLIRFQLDIARFDNNEINIAELEETLDYLESIGMYAILSPTFYGKVGLTVGALTRPTPEIIKVMPPLASRLAKRSNVLFGLVNEVEPARWNSGDVMPGLIQLTRGVRLANPNAIIVVPGFSWNKDFSVFSTQGAFPIENIMYDLHYYQSWDINKNDVTDKYVNYTGIIGKYPLLIGEAGVPFSNNMGGPSSPFDRVYIQKAFDLVKAYPKMVHYTGFAMAPGGLIDGRMNPNSRGKLYFDDMNDPNSVHQTDFTK